MPHNLTESSTFTANVEVPDDGDLVRALSVEPGFQAVANRTKYLSDNKVTGPASLLDREIPIADSTSGKLIKASGAKVDSSNEYSYATPKTRTVFVPWSLFRVRTGWNQDGADFFGATTNGVAMYADLLNLPAGCVITSVRVALEPGEARATSGNRMQVQLFRYIPNTGTFLTTITASGSAVTDDGNAAAQLVTLSPTYTVIATEWLAVRVVAGNTAASFNDALYWVEVTYTDPGPRNPS